MEINMQLISTRFFLFFLLTLIFYYLFPARHRWCVLLCASVVFYLFAGVFSFIFILIFTLSSYFFALTVQKCDRQGSELVSPEGKKVNKRRRKKKSYLITVLSVAMLLSLLIFVRGVAREAALGISFYSLRVISYLIDVHRGRIEAQRNIFRYTLFVTFFPLAYLGPVVTYRELGGSLYEGKSASADGLASGLLRITFGVFKKVVVANALSLPLASIAAYPNKYNGAYVLFLLVFYSAEIYCDFSGGIDICLGASKLLGIGLPENFDRPFSSTNLREFWNRWHITLGEWFETYVFYPLSLSRPMQKLSRLCRRKFGTRVGKRLPLYVATMLTWLMTGLWHGGEGHFVAWGLINGALVLISQELSRPVGKFYDRHEGSRESLLRKVLGRVRVFLIIGAVRLLDVYRSLPLTLSMLTSSLYKIDSYKELFTGGIFEVISPTSLCVVLIALTVVFFVSASGSRGADIVKKPLATATCIAFLTLASLVFGTYGLGFDASDFIYSHFNG